MISVEPAAASRVALHPERARVEDHRAQAHARVVARDDFEPASPSEPPGQERAQPVDAFDAIRREFVDDPREALLIRLATDEAELVVQLQQAARKCATTVLCTLDRPQMALKVAQLLRELTATHSAIARRLISVLDAADQLRARRLLLEAQGSARDD
jgi:hypothetical protein